MSIRKKTESSKKLTEKEELFCIYFVKSLNATQSYFKAYKCSYITAHAEGYKTLAKPCVKTEIKRLKKEKFQAIMADKDDIVEKYMRIAFSDITDYVEYGRTGKIKCNKSTEVDGSLIEKIKSGKTGFELKLKDSLKALEWLSDYFEINPLNSHRREYDEKRLLFEKEKFDFEKEKFNKLNFNLDENKINNTMQSLAELLKNPVPERLIGSEVEEK